MKARLIEAAMACVLLIGAVCLPPRAAAYTAGAEILLAEEETGMTGEMILKNEGPSLPQGEVHKVVLDAGHGGRDAGKTGVNGALEKDINLEIVCLLKEELEEAGFEVALTRDTDNGLYQESDSNKKMADMKARCGIIEEEEPEIVVSIHQNSYHEETVKGPQVFYYTGSEKGKQLAEVLQNSFTELVGTENNRTVKSNSKYYLLLHVKQPIVIVECGFLSNPEEAELLSSAEYQKKVTEILRKGIVEYFTAQ